MSVMCLQRRYSTLVIANANRLIHFVEKDLTISNTSGRGSFYDGVDDRVHRFIFHHNLQLDLRQQVHRIFPTTICGRVSLLPPMPPDVSYGHSLNASLRENVLDALKDRRLNNRLDISDDPLRL